MTRKELEKFIKNRKAHDEDAVKLGNELQEVEKIINETNAQVESKLVLIVDTELARLSQ